jgi:hypothetical protein
MVHFGKGRAPRERNVVAIDGPDEVLRYWTTEFGCTLDELRSTVGAVGVSADDVRAHLAKRR